MLALCIESRSYLYGKPYWTKVVEIFLFKSRFFFKLRTLFSRWGFQHSSWDFFFSCRDFYLKSRIFFIQVEIFFFKLRCFYSSRDFFMARFLFQVENFFFHVEIFISNRGFYLMWRIFSCGQKFSTCDKNLGVRKNSRLVNLKKRISTWIKKILDLR